MAAGTEVTLRNGLPGPVFSVFQLPESPCGELLLAALARGIGAGEGALGSFLAVAQEGAEGAPGGLIDRAEELRLFAFIVARLDKQKVGAETLCDVARQESGKLFFSQQLC